MELNEHGFLEELLSLRRDNWETFPNGMSDQFFSNGWSLDCFNENQSGILPNLSLESGFDVSIEPSFNCSMNNDVYYPYENNGLLVPAEMNSSYHQKRDTHTPTPTHTFTTQDDIPLLMEDEEHSLLNNDFHSFEEKETSCKAESIQATESVPAFNMGLCHEKKNKIKKLDGQPSKNLMAERRRRKRLNDRLSMLRSVVPRISKMDRTSILGDTIEYMKELLDKIKNLQGDTEEESNHLNFKGILKDLKENDLVLKNTPKFDVEKKNMNTRIEICCSSKPGLLMSTVNTLEALGLEIHQCVISCFNDFAMQASCSEESEKRGMSCEEIKQALFKNAGYGGRCI
ncbi:Transcription factor bhlh [Thalictrum thalictroides]|uniref:Transcription factor bhlh n=1 Tax=Thalictrum thalictroides TaxID=46969 RepID=A0A7J6VTN5_THATH|nr:Transcription factor bhlh [Thalictrum thalictroides]